MRIPDGYHRLSLMLQDPDPGEGIGIFILFLADAGTAHDMIIIRCRTCNGTGEVTNEQYRICQALKSHETKRYFHLPMETESTDESDQQQDACNNVRETVECPVCEGAGEIAFDEDDWELRIVADADDAEPE